MGDVPAASRWSMLVEELPRGTVEFGVALDDVPVSHGEVLRLWREVAGFRAFFGEAIASSTHEAVFFETPAVTRATLGRPFRGVLVEAPALARVSPEPHVFEAELRDAGPSGVGTFPNLGGDALLVVPAARAEPAAYPHLLAFLRGAPVEQRDALWAAVGEAVERRLGHRPLWVSTSGLGVAWLHVRLDAVPKYYVHAPYRAAVPPGP